VHNLIAEDGQALCVLLKTVNKNTLEQAEELIPRLDSLLDSYHFESTHKLGRAYFQRELVRMEQREVVVSSLIAAILVIGILFFIFRRWLMVFIAFTGIGLSLLFFLGTLSLLGRELNALAALYPILMCIVGVADTIHLTSKYIDELKKGAEPGQAIRVTIREIGLATFITCITTAIGFASLLTNRTAPIQGFGINAAIGVVVAFLVIYGWLWAMLPRFNADRLIRYSREYAFWDDFMAWVTDYTLRRRREIVLFSVILLGLCLVGISKIHTNYRIKNNLPRGESVTADFLYFEEKFSGFRPVEVAVFPKNGRRANDFEVLKSVERVEQRMRTYPPIKTVSSVNDVYRSLNAMQQGNRQDAYCLPDSASAFAALDALAARAPAAELSVLVGKNKDVLRIAARMQDAGRDSVSAIMADLESWWKANTDSSVVDFRLTGTGLILDKNSVYIRDNMLLGLVPSVLVVALLMGLMFRDVRMMVIFCIPNVLPLFFAGAMIGFLGIPLEAGIATVFSIVFGIATDDTIHFLSTFRLYRGRGATVEAAVRGTLAETGKAMCISSIILFFSFLVMLFSIHPPSVIVGLLVSITLAGALFCDLFLAPVLLRSWIRDK
jgi:predicted RND superfamily exporter protein